MEWFLKLLHITVKQKEKPVVPLVSLEDLQGLATKLNNGDIDQKEISDPTVLLNFRTRQIDMSEDRSIIKNGSSNQIIHLLMKRFGQDIYVLAQLLEKTKMRRYDDDFMKHIEFAHKEIDRLVISNELKTMCAESYELLRQFNKFVEYYCAIKHEKDLLTWAKISCVPLHGIDITTEE